jgi:O-antigen/teichoic acid export membrane protein
LATAQLNVTDVVALKYPTAVRLVLNTVSNFVGQGIVLLVTFFSTPYVTRKLGATQYGTLNLLIICIFSVSLLNLGINTSLVKYLAELMPKGEMGEVQRYFSTALTVLVGIGLLVAVLIFASAGAIVHHFFKDTGEFTSATYVALRIASIAFVLQFLTQVLLSVAAGVQRFEILNIVGTASDTARLLGMIVVVYLGGGLVALMALLMVVSLCTCTTYAFVAKALAPQLSLRPGFSVRHLRALVTHSKFVLVGNAGRQLVGSADNVIIGYCLPVSALAYYGISYSIAQRLWTLVGNVASVVFPAASAFSGSDDQAHVQELYLRGTKIAAAAACFPALALAIFSRELMLYWLSPEYAANGARVLACLSLGFLVNSFSFVPYQTLQSTHYAATTAKGSVGYALINVVMFLLLIPRYGIVGASSAFLLSQFAFVPWFTRLANQRIGVPHSAVISSYAKVFVVAAASCAITWTGRFLVHSLISLGLVVGVGFSLYLILAYSLVLDRRERTACKLLLQQATCFVGSVTSIN